ncbi:MAG: hypothetical protein P1V36_01450 [Planctomycetota bacterium]|nr:hypothetical protein [Planctomycetota bacterium]
MSTHTIDRAASAIDVGPPHARVAPSAWSPWMRPSRDPPPEHATLGLDDPTETLAGA